MNDRERILAFFAGEPIDRVPWFGDLTYWAGAMERRGEVPAGYQRSAAYYRFHRELGVGFYLQGYFPFRVVDEGGVRHEEQLDGDTRRRALITPLGTLHETWQYLPEAYATAPVERLVKTVADLGVLRYWWERIQYEADYAEAERRRDLVADLGVVLCYLPRCPFMELVTTLIGIRTLVDIWGEAPDELEETLAVMAATSDRAAALAVAAPVDCLMIPENLSSEVVGKRFYRQYMRPWESRWLERIHAAGKVSYVHLDGTLRGLVADVAETGFQVIEACTPQPVGDVAMGELRALARPQTILWGGLPGSYFTPLVSDAEFERHTREMLDVMVADRRMVLGVADQVPPDGLRSRVARVVELVEQYGRY